MLIKADAEALHEAEAAVYTPKTPVSKTQEIQEQEQPLSASAQVASALNQRISALNQGDTPQGRVV